MITISKSPLPITQRHRRKTYHLKRGGRLSDLSSMHQIGKPTKNCVVVLHVVPLYGNLWTGGRIAHLNRAAGFLVHPVQIGFRIRHLRLNLKDVRADCLCQRLGNLCGHAGRRKNTLQVFLTHCVLPHQSFSFPSFSMKYSRASSNVAI